MSENRLHLETSPYLLQHKDNPVHWWSWGPEALAEAKRTGKPILLSVGYAACHWCHVMAHESFEDPATAEVMNGLYVNIKVDREERPDIDAIYMGALHRLGEQGGWPLTMFLDSDARPFWGGTYFPKDQRYGRPAFVTVLLRIAEAFDSQPEQVRANADKIIASLAGQSVNPSGFVASEAMIRELAGRITRAVDPEHGGLNGAPKFPQWNVFWLLWRGAIRFDDAAARDAVLNTLTHICQGGIYDHLGGGFARYSVDERWLVPHFEKMLYDNALLIDLLTEAWRETQDPLYAARILETVDWLNREMIANGGGFAASLDADSEGEEGKFYVWTAREIADVLGQDDAVFFGHVYDVTQAGNFEGHSILNRLHNLAPLSEADEARLAVMRAKLFAARAPRIRPGWDDKVLADWNGLMIAAVARAAVVFAKSEWLAMAKRAFVFVVEKMQTPDGRLWHSARGGISKAPATASDYANMTWGALRLYQATGDANYLAHAVRWTTTLDRHYWDTASGGYFTAADDTSDVIVRLKSASDDAVPSANTIQLSNLIALSALTGDATYDRRARDLFVAFSGAVASGPVGHCGLLAAALDLDGIVQIKIRSGDTTLLCQALHGVSVPGAIEFARISNDVQFRPEAAAVSGGPELAGALICVGPVCGAPLVDAASLCARLLQVRRSMTGSD
ncbi:MAG: thioredoxin domain-containing protein [Hyphomicrobium sp.]|nr:thioredoxin domain-containing protein [Hyphomicrobium sp.]